ncbi:MAG: GTP cyclohydrolase II [Gammaproteobacteria bacterium]|nr:GTP cyclohydrolase II [Gammaproteobacteria bacterium]
MSDQLISAISSAKLPLAQGEFQITVYLEHETGLEHVALQYGDVDCDQAILLRLHSSCLTGDVFGSLRCDCGTQLQAALDQIAKEGGLLLYMQQEGRGIGLANKVKAYALQDLGLDTVEANQHLGFSDDLRDYKVAAEILKSIGVKKVKLLTNNPKKMSGLREAGIEIQSREPIIISSQAHNLRYLSTKRDKLGHLLPKDAT